MSGKKINQLPFLGNPNNEGMIPLEYSGTTYHIKFSSVTQNISDNISYVGNDINCLKIKSGMSLTEVVESIGNTLCINNTTVNPCFSPFLQEETSNPIDYLFNLTISSWCNLNSPYECSGESPLNYLIDLLHNTWQNENIPYECDGENPLNFIFNLTYITYQNENIPYECDGENILGKIMNFSYVSWENRNN